MIKDVIPFRELWSNLRPGIRGEAIASFISFIEKKTGAFVAYDASVVSSGDADLIELLGVAEKLKKAGIISSFSKMAQVPDEPPIFHWRVDFGEKHKSVAGGMSSENYGDALVASLAEALERYLWFEKTDYFMSPKVSSSEKMRHPAVLPERFAGFTEEQKLRPELALTKDKEYLWIRGWSWTQDREIYIPAQIISYAAYQAGRRDRKEPTIRIPITTGLATYPDRIEAVLRGALEIIERDAFMITWLNQLSLPRIRLEELAHNQASLKKILASCKKYRIGVHAVRLITDAPAHAVCVITEDLTKNRPRIVLGLKAHQNIVSAVEGALLEALRMRRNIRDYLKRPPATWRTDKSVQEILHTERTLYWAEGDRDQNLRFMFSGEEKTASSGVWEDDSPKQHLSRIVDWCKSRGYEMSSVSLLSSQNPTPWHVEMVVMPELQPIHQTEKYPYLGGVRLKEIPELFGYEPRKVSYSEKPHPFA